MSNNFNIYLANGISLSVRTRRKKNCIKAYELLQDGKLFTIIYLIHDLVMPSRLTWKSDDQIDPYIVDYVGNAVEVFRP